jgi:hypothetical protein
VILNRGRSRRHNRLISLLRREYLLLLPGYVGNREMKEAEGRRRKVWKEGVEDDAGGRVTGGWRAEGGRVEEGGQEKGG